MRLPAILPAAALLVVVACSPPRALVGPPVDEVTVAEAQERDLTGTRVRWGGEVVTVTVEQQETCFEMVGRPLDRMARPRDVDATDGRFLACAPGFYEPTIYAAGRTMTFVGTLEPSVVQKIGEHDYRYPRLRAESLYLWPKPPDRDVVYTYPWIVPYGGGPYIGVWPYGWW